MKQIKTQDAVGHILCHDITQIIKGVTKDARFRKGHVVTEADIPVLLSLGKEHLYVWEQDDSMMHEDDAAKVLYDICAGENILPSDVKEGKIELIAACDGLLCADLQKLRAVNSIGEIMIASRHRWFPVRQGDKLAGTRVIPLSIKQEKLEHAQEIGGTEPIFSVKPFPKKRVGVITTGSEVFHGRIQDTFTPVIIEKLAEYGASVIEHRILPDDHTQITGTIQAFLSLELDLIICTGGMSVDPDDKTPLAIRNSGAEIISYGAPVLPGAMFLLSYYNDVPIIGLPGCVMYAKRTIFDLVLPRLIADVPVTAEDLAGLGHGGLCLNCDPCTYPNCGFGKGV